MSQKQIINWYREIKQALPQLGHWQALNVALYSLGIVAARHSAPSRVSEKLSCMGKPMTVQRRLERFLDNGRIEVGGCCEAWARWLLKHWQGQRVVLLVDETKLGQHLSVMVVGVAYQGCCIPLAWWCYPPKQWPLGQVELIRTLLERVARALPPGTVPLVQADRGIGCSPALVRVIEALGWHFLFRVQKSTRLKTAQGKSYPLGTLVKPGESWSGRGQVFKKAGWLTLSIHLIWEQGYRDLWCLITNDPTLCGQAYAQRFWQEVSFRDLKSDGWQWQASHIFTPDHAERLLLVMTLAYALTLMAGSLALAQPDTFPVAKRSQSRPPFSLFRLGLRLIDSLPLNTALHRARLALARPPLLHFSSSQSVGP
jgi:hypothetical protein